MAEEKIEPSPPYESPPAREMTQIPIEQATQESVIETIPRSTASPNPGQHMTYVQNVAPPPQQQTTPLNLLREQPAHVYCPQKRAVFQTKTDTKDSDKTWFAVLGLCLVCPCIACFPLKGCCGDGMLQDIDQYCGGCGKQLTHRPYNHENQILAPDHDHDSASGGYHGGMWTAGPPPMQYAPQQSYAQPQYGQAQHVAQ